MTLEDVEWVDEDDDKNQGSSLGRIPEDQVTEMPLENLPATDANKSGRAARMSGSRMASIASIDSSVVSNSGWETGDSEDSYSSDEDGDDRVVGLDWEDEGDAPWVKGRSSNNRRRGW